MNITYQEITTQYEAVEKVIDQISERRSEIKELFDTTKGQIICIGCGSSYSIANSAAIIVRNCLGKPAASIPGGDLLIHFNSYIPLLKEALIIVLSRSGQTSEILQSIEAIYNQDIPCRILSLTCVEDSPLSKLSDLVFNMPWAFDQSVYQTRTVTCLYSAIVGIVAMITGNSVIRDAIRTVTKHGKTYLSANEEIIKSVANNNWENVVVLGDAEISGLCEEAALAFKEICKIPSNYYHVLDVRHGPILLIDNKSLVIIVLSGQNSKYEISLVDDIVAQGAKVIVYSDIPVKIDGVLNIYFNYELPHIVRGIPFIGICLLLAYYKAIANGMNPDAETVLDSCITEI